MRKLVLEKKEQKDNTMFIESGRKQVIIAPIVNEGYWLYRIKLYKDQSLIAFPKIGTLGVGFSQEEDFNRNLPFSVPPKYLMAHIWINRKYKQITKKLILEAIEMLRTQILIDRPGAAEEIKRLTEAFERVSFKN
jgi:hypothetical protein